MNLDSNEIIRGLATAAALASLAGACSTAPVTPAREQVEVKLSVNETLLPALAQSLGYFEREGIRVRIVDAAQFSGEDYLVQEPLNKGQIDASYNWFHHVIFGARHGFPVKAVLLLNDAPGVEVMVANREKERIRSAADFKGKRIAEGAGYSTKSVVTNFLATKAGLPPHSYSTILKESEGREAAVLKALKAEQVDVLVFREPMTSALLRTNLVTPLYELTSREKTVEAFGAPWPAQCLFVAPRYIEEHPETVQRLVNAWVRTMRYLNDHTAEQIIEQLPPSYFEKRDRKAETDKLRNTMSTFARGDYSFSPPGVQLIVDSALASSFDDSPEGIWRRTGDSSKIRPDELYTNRFVERAMREIAPSR
jgi:NitT/TauT family transport system substrate-binding protein